MELSPIAVYSKAVDAVPSIKYSLAVAGVIAAATIALNLSGEEPKRAILAFIFVLAGMYLLLIFASISKVDEIIRGPVVLVVWALTILFIASLVLTFTAYSMGVPCGWARLVDAACADVRSTSAESSGKDDAVANPSSVDGRQTETRPAPAPASAVAQQPVRVEETFRITDSSNDCGANQTRTIEYCLASGAQVLNWSGPTIESANCGSAISNVRRVAGRENCIATDVSVRGCGYDNILGIKNCKGRGWIGGSIVINGQRAPG